MVVVKSIAHVSLVEPRSGFLGAVSGEGGTAYLAQLLGGDLDALPGLVEALLCRLLLLALGDVLIFTLNRKRIARVYKKCTFLSKQERSAIGFLQCQSNCDYKCSSR